MVFCFRVEVLGEGFQVVKRGRSAFKTWEEYTIYIPALLNKQVFRDICFAGTDDIKTLCSQAAENIVES